MPGSCPAFSLPHEANGAMSQPDTLGDNHGVAAIPGLLRQYSRIFPWYADLTRQHGITEESPLSALPLMDDSLLAEHYYTRERPDLPGAISYLTSGTASGLRKKILYSQQDHEQYLGHRRALFEHFMRDIAPGATAVADLGTGHAAASAKQVFSDMGFLACDIDFTRPASEHLAELNRLKPDVFYTMPMILDQLLSLGDVGFSPQKIVVVGDIATENWRRHVASSFGISFEDILDVFGSIEIGAIAYYCAATGLYHFHDHILPEVVAPQDLTDNASGGSRASGEGTGVLLLTSLAREYFPALRFVTNDIVSGLRLIEWNGRLVYALERIEGRFGGDIKHGERISQYDLTAAVNQVFPGAVFDVCHGQKLEIRVYVDEVTAEQGADVRAALLAASPDVATMVESQLVDDITVAAAGPGEPPAGRAKRSFTLKDQGPCAG